MMRVLNVDLFVLYSNPIGYGKDENLEDAAFRGTPVNATPNSHEQTEKRS